MNIFFSYTVRDGMVTRDHLRQVAERLQKFSSPYMDLLEHRCGGHQPSVIKAIWEADVFLLCVTPYIFRSPWVALECAIAQKRGIPVYATSLASWLTTKHANELPLYRV